MLSTSRCCSWVRLFPLVVLLFAPGCGQGTAAGKMANLKPATAEFGIYWPPADPQETPAVTIRPLLRGTLSVQSQPSERGPCDLRLVATVTRPSTEADRQSWNSTLANADIDWMKEVRVWDADEQ